MRHLKLLSTLLALMLSAVAMAQSAETLDDLFSRKTGLGGQLAIYYKTMFGPVGASLGYSNVTKKPNLYINLGYVF